MDYRTQQERINELTGMLQIEDLMSRQARTLSLGQRIRCELAASLLHSPPIIFLDEPTIGLDVSVRSRVRDFIREINHSENKTIILTSHDVNDIESLASRVTVIDTGKILFDGGLTRFTSRFGSGQKTMIIQFETEAAQDDLTRQIQDLDVQLQDFDGFSLQLKLMKHIPPGQLIECFQRIAPVQDIQIENEPISEMVKRIYERKDTPSQPA